MPIILSKKAIYIMEFKKKLILTVNKHKEHSLYTGIGRRYTSKNKVRNEKKTGNQRKNFIIFIKILILHFKQWHMYVYNPMTFFPNRKMIAISNLAEIRIES